MCQVCILRRSAISKKQTRSQLSHVTYVVTICGHSTHQLRSSSYTKYVIREIFWFIIPYSQLDFTLDAGLRKNWNWKPLLCVMFLKQTGKKIEEISGVTNQAWLLQFMWNWVWIRGAIKCKVHCTMWLWVVMLYMAWCWNDDISH